MVAYADMSCTPYGFGQGTPSQRPASACPVTRPFWPLDGVAGLSENDLLFLPPVHDGSTAVQLWPQTSRHRFCTRGALDAWKQSRTLDVAASVRRSRRDLTLRRNHCPSHLRFGMPWLSNIEKAASVHGPLLTYICLLKARRGGRSGTGFDSERGDAVGGRTALPFNFTLLLRLDRYHGGDIAVGSRISIDRLVRRFAGRAH